MSKKVRLNKRGKLVCNIAALATTIGICSFMLNGCSGEIIDSSLDELFNDSNNTKTEQAIEDYLDKDEYGNSSLTRIEGLEKYLDMADKLETLDFSKLTGEEEVSKQVENYEMLDADELKELYDKVMKTKEKYNIKSNNMEVCDETIEYFYSIKELRTQAMLVNNYINQNGYSIIEDFGIDTAKSVIYSTDSSFEDIRINPNLNYSMPEDYTMTYKDDNEKEFVSIAVNSDLYNVIDDVYYAQNKREVEEFSPEYNKERNNKLKSNINDIKKVSQNEYVIDNGKVKTK